MATENFFAKLTWEYVVNSSKFSISYETKVINPVGG
jgi:hypothetical protein